MSLSIENQLGNKLVRSSDAVYDEKRSHLEYGN